MLLWRLCDDFFQSYTMFLKGIFNIDAFPLVNNLEQPHPVDKVQMDAEDEVV